MFKNVNNLNEFDQVKIFPSQTKKLAAQASSALLGLITKSPIKKLYLGKNVDLMNNILGFT